MKRPVVHIKLHKEKWAMYTRRLRNRFGFSSATATASDDYQFAELPGKGIHDFNLFVPPHYLLGPTLGDGEFAKVRVAHNLESGFNFAMKIFRKRKGTNKSLVDEHIWREISILKGISHENIIKIYDVIIYGDRVFLAMEWTTYGDMRKYVNRQGPLANDHAKDLFGQMTSGLTELHRRHVVHLDLKLENLLLDHKLRVKIADFGCARVQIGKFFTKPCGSYAYGAPELISSQQYDGTKTDVWSMGVILFAMVVQKLPYSDTGMLADLLIERKKVPAMPDSVNFECQNLVLSMLTYSDSDRIPLAQAVAHPWMVGRKKAPPG